MPYSNFAIHCPNCESITEPVSKSRTNAGGYLASYRCGDCSNAFQQRFNVNHQAPQITPPEEPEEVEKPDPPAGDVLDWSEEDKDLYIEHYGFKKYKKLVAKHFKDGHAEAEKTTDKQRPLPFDARKWTNQERDDFIDEWGRDKYQERFVDAHEKQKQETQ